MIMKKFKAAFLFAAVFSVFLFTGCGEESNIENKLIGKWEETGLDFSSENLAENHKLTFIYNFSKDKTGSISVIDLSTKETFEDTFTWEAKTFPAPENYKDIYFFKNQKDYTEVYIKANEMGNRAYLYVPKSRSTLLKADTLLPLEEMNDNKDMGYFVNFLAEAFANAPADKADEVKDFPNYIIKGMLDSGYFISLLSKK